MRRRILLSIGIAATTTFVAVLSLPVQGQGQNQTIGAGTPGPVTRRLMALFQAAAEAALQGSQP